ncbi:MAG: 50S ribosomal protein L17 [Candidatus Neomarinimicrobiota bacterium]|jgi:large subunit ribosomal protein L17|tara:strand:- start:193 stop:588 length:396 start_codon:yes stop_codon:yes gene_type:complete
MRHQKKGRKLGVNPSHRKALLRNLASNLIKHKRIQTTDSRAKELRTFIEPLITKAKKADFNSTRQILKKLPFKDDVHTLVHDIAPQYVDRKGGYTRIIKRGFRDNDRASVSIIEFVEFSSAEKVEVEESEK